MGASAGGAARGGLKTMAGGLGLTGIAALGMGLQFDTSMNKIVALVGYSRGEVDKMKGSVLGLAGETGKAPKELADALYYLASSGLDSKGSLDALKYSARASAAGLGDMTAIADAVSSAMNAYTPAVMSAEHATDVLIATAKAGKAEPEELAKSMGRVLPIASQLGVTFEDVGGAVAALSLKGLDAAESVTAVRQTLQAIIKPSDQGKKLLHHYGLSLDEVQKSLKQKGLLATLLMLRHRFHGNTEQLAKLFAGVEGFNSVLSLTSRGGKQAAGVFADVKNNAGGTNKAFEDSKDASFRLRQGWAVLQVQLIKLGSTLGAVIMFFDEHKTALTALLVLLGAAAAGYVGYKAALLGVAVAQRIATVAQNGLNLSMLGNPIVLIVTLLFALVAALVIAYKRCETFRNIVDGAWKAIKAVTVAVFGTILAFLKRWWPLLLVLFTGGLGLIAVLIVKNWNGIKRFTVAVWNAVLGFLRRWWPLLLGIMTGGLGLAVVLIIRNWSRIRDFTRNVWNAIKGFLRDVWSAIRSAASTAWSAIRTAITTPITKARDVVRGVWSSIKSAASDAWNKILSGAGKFASNLKDKIVGAFKGAANKVVDFVNAIIGVVEKIPGVKIGKVGHLATGGRIGARGAEQAQALAHGGKVMRPLAIVGEEAPRHPEYVIPTNPAYRGRAMGLFGRLAGELGVPGFALGGIIGDIGRLPGKAIDVLSAGPKALVGKLPNPADMLPGWLRGLGKYVIGKAGSFVKDKFSSIAESLFGGGDFGGGGMPWGGLGRFIKGVTAAASIHARHYPYKYGGGHGSFSGPYDCSGAVSAVLHAMGLLGSPVTTDSLKHFGDAGDGRLVTIGVRGSTGRSAHTMMKLGSRYFESGSGHGAQWTSGWSGHFPIHRHPPGMAMGGVLDKAAELFDPRVVGWGLRKGGTLPFLGSFHRGGVAAREGLAHVAGGEPIGMPEIHVYIGDRELTDMVRVELRDRDRAGAGAYRAGVVPS